MACPCRTAPPTIGSASFRDSEWGTSDPHGHDDVAVLVIVGAEGAELAGGLGVFEFEADVAGADGLEEVENIAGVEADGEAVAVVRGLEGIFGLASFGGGGGEFQLAFLQAQADGAGALIGELGDALDGGVEVVAVESGEFVVVLGKDGFEVGELAGELARGEQARADAEEEGGFVLGKVNAFDFGGVDEGLQLVHALFGDEGLHLAGHAFNFSPLRSMWARRWPSVATMVMDSGLSTMRAPFRV